MRREVTDCDKCGKECRTSVRLDIPNGATRETDGEIRHDFEMRDLCPECVEKLFGYMFGRKRSVETVNKTKWFDDRDAYPSAKTNDAVALALKWFKIEPKE